MSELRRRMMQQAGEFVIPYITDGLVFYLDGIERGKNPAYWKEWAGDMIIPFTDQTFGTNYVRTNSGIYIAESTLSLPLESATLEVGCEVINYPATGASCIVAFNGAGLVLVSNNNTAWCKTAPSTNGHYLYSGVNKSKCQYVILSNKTYMDGYVNTSDGLSIGLRKSNNTTIDCKIYYIRGYNRPLTDEELEFNKSIDTERFGRFISYIK